MDKDTNSVNVDNASKEASAAENLSLEESKAGNSGEEESAQIEGAVDAEACTKAEASVDADKGGADEAVGEADNKDSAAEASVADAEASVAGAEAEAETSVAGAEASVADAEANNNQGKINAASFASAAAKFFTLERIVGIVVLLLIPCLMSTWVHVSATDKLGVSVNLSVPDTLSTSSKVLGRLEKTGDVMSEVKGSLGQAATLLKESGVVLSEISNILSSNQGSVNKEALTEAIANLIDTTAIQDGVDASADAVDKAEGAVNNAQANADKVENNYNGMLSIIKAICSAVSIVWYGFLLLILVASILLIAGIRGRYVTNIVALSITLLLSVGTIVGVTIANDIILDALANAAGSWIVAVFPGVLATTAWPWITAIASAVCLVAVCVFLSRNRKKSPKKVAA